MAGIGFRLQKLVSGESYTDLIKAYAFSSVIAAGPMLITIVSLGLVHHMGKSWMGPGEAAYFVGIAVYCFAWAMVGIGGILNVVTRYIADHYFSKNFSVFTSTFFSALEVIVLFQSIPALIFLSHAPLLLYEKWMVFVLYLFINGIWLAMVFLSAAKSFLWIILAYLIGGGVALLGGWFLGSRSGFPGVLAGFTLGQAVTFFILVYRILKEFGYQRTQNFDFLAYMVKVPYLFGVGFFLNLGIWIDKFLMWGLSHLGEKFGNGLYGAPDYDTPMFLAYLCVIPAMAFFLIQMETSFAKSYLIYFRSIQNRESWTQILRNKESLLDTITKNFQVFIVFQGIISGLAILLVYDLAEILSLNNYQLGIFRIGLMATFLQMGFIMFLNLYFYFDFQKNAFWIVALFCISNAGFTYLTILLGHESYGFGFAASCFLALLLTFLVLDQKLLRLDYWTFMRQPILAPKLDLDSK